MSKTKRNIPHFASKNSEKDFERGHVRIPCGDFYTEDAKRIFKRNRKRKERRQNKTVEEE